MTAAAQAGVLTHAPVKSTSAGETAYIPGKRLLYILLPIKSGPKVLASDAQAPRMWFSLSIRDCRCIRSRTRILQVCLQGEARWAPCEKTRRPADLVTSPDAGSRDHAVPHHPTAAMGTLPCTPFAVLSRTLCEMLLLGGRLQLGSKLPTPMAAGLMPPSVRTPRNNLRLGSRGRNPTGCCC